MDDTETKMRTAQDHARNIFDLLSEARQFVSKQTKGSALGLAVWMDAEGAPHPRTQAPLTLTAINGFAPTSAHSALAMAAHGTKLARALRRLNGDLSRLPGANAQWSPMASVGMDYISRPHLTVSTSADTILGSGHTSFEGFALRISALMDAMTRTKPPHSGRMWRCPKAKTTFLAEDPVCATLIYTALFHAPQYKNLLAGGRVENMPEEVLDPDTIRAGIRALVKKESA